VSNRPLPNQNPFELVFDGLWKLARSNKNLVKWLPQENQIDFQSWIGPKEEHAPADYPQLTLLPESTFSNLKSSSTSTSVDRVYTWNLVTGSFEIDEVYNQIQWELFVAMADVCNCLGKLKWEDENFVKNANFGTSTEGTFSADGADKIRGFSLTWPIEVAMQFTTSKLSTGDCS